ERRQVDARQPADGDAAGGRARDAGHDARPQGAPLRVERTPVPPDRYGRCRHRRPEPDHPADRAAGANGDRGGRSRTLRRRRPNVGKSSLYNRLVGAERTIVSEIPGTTRDTIDTLLEHDGRTFQLVDTAGLRRKRKQRQGIEYYSELRALDAAQRADVGLVLI